MKSMQHILAGLAMLLLYIPLQGAITTTIIDNAIAVSTDKKAVEGYRGCEASKLEKVPAYIFELQVKKPGKFKTCNIASPGRWTTHSKQNSDDGTAIFEHLPFGKYRVIGYAGFAIGCEIIGAKEGYPNKSIVYEMEKSKLLELKNLFESNSILTDQAIPQKNSDLLIFPNPANDKINIQLESDLLSGKIDIILYDVLGSQLNQITQQEYEIGTIRTWDMEISPYPTGTYLIRIVDGAGSMLFQKVIFENK